MKSREKIALCLSFIFIGIILLPFLVAASCAIPGADDFSNAVIKNNYV